MARVTFVDAIDTVRGALDEVKDGQAKRARLVCKWHYWGEKWIDEDGSKVHLVYMYHFHEGEWSEGATRNREMIKVAQRMSGCAIIRRNMARKTKSKQRSGNRSTRSIAPHSRLTARTSSTSTAGCSRKSIEG